MKFKPNDRVRIHFPGHISHLMEATVLNGHPNPFLIDRATGKSRFVGRPAYHVDLDGYGPYEHHSGGELWFDEDHLRPITRPGSWSNLEKALGFDMRKEREIA